MPKEDTQFRPGQSGNPGGRPKDTEFRRILRERSPEAVEELFRIARTGKREANKLKAIEIILAYGYGKPAIAVDLDLSLSRRLQDMSIDELVELDSRLDTVALLPAVANGNDGES
jgi:hypothetical protein